MRWGGGGEVWRGNVFLFSRLRGLGSGGLGPGRRAQPSYFCSRPPVSWPAMFFCKDNTFFWFFAFPVFFRQAAKFAASIERPKPKNASALEGLRPLTPWPGALRPGPRWGLCPQIDLRYKLVLPCSPLSGDPCLQILWTRTATGSGAAS